METSQIVQKKVADKEVQIVVRVTKDPEVIDYTEKQIDQELEMANEMLEQSQKRVDDLQLLKDKFTK